MKKVLTLIIICLCVLSCGLLPDRTPPEEILKNIGSMTLADQGFAILNPKGDRVYVLDHSLKKRVNYYYLGTNGYRDICFYKDYYMLHKKTGYIHKMDPKNAEITSVMNIEFVLGEKYRGELPDSLIKKDGANRVEHSDARVWINDVEVTGYKYLCFDGTYFYTSLPSEIAQLKAGAQTKGDYKIVQKWLPGKVQGLFYENNSIWYVYTSYVGDTETVVKQLDLTKTDPLYGWIMPAKTLRTDCINCIDPVVKGNILWIYSITDKKVHRITLDKKPEGS